MPTVTAPSAAELTRQLAAARAHIANALRILDGLDAGVRVDATAALIEQLNRLRDLAESFAAIAMQLEVWSRERTEEARSLLANAQLELTAGEDRGRPGGP